MFRLTGLVIGAGVGLFLTRSFFLEFLLMGGDFAIGGIAISCIAALVCGLGGYIIGGIIDSVRKKKPEDS